MAQAFLSTDLQVRNGCRKFLAQWLAFSCFVGSWGAATVEAQNQPPRVTVQQPVYRVFSTNTSVLVPDGGRALLGGVDSARMGSVSRGVPMLGRLPGTAPLFNSRAFGADFNSVRNDTTAEIIDLREMDEAVLAEAQRLRDGRVTEFRDTAAFQAERMARRQAAANFMAQHVGRNQRPQPDNVRRANEMGPPSAARQLLKQGDDALARGDLEAAVKFYRAAEERSKP